MDDLRLTVAHNVRRARAAKGLSDEFYGIDPEKNRPRIGNRLLDGAGLHHFDEHRPELEAWLRSRG